MSATSRQQVVVMEFGKLHDTADTADFCPLQLVTDLLRTCYGETDMMDFVLWVFVEHTSRYYYRAMLRRARL